MGGSWRRRSARRWGAVPSRKSGSSRLVKHQPLWSVNVLVSPGNRLWGWTFLGLRREIPIVLREALRAAGFRDAEPWTGGPAPLVSRHSPAA
jgi:hypothetical protein